MPRFSENNITLAARRQLMELIEEHAFYECLPLHKAAEELVRRPEHFELVVQACGQWWKGKPPSARVLLKWRNRTHMELAAKYPNLTPAEHRLASPYLPLKKRLKLRTSMGAARDQASRLISRGYSHKDVAGMLNASLATVYRWCPVKPKDPQP